MSFVKISDPNKRDAIVKEYLDLKKKIRSNLLRERTGELELQADLSKFHKPITETQKATAKEITKGLKPIREGIEKLPEAMQPIKDDWEEEVEPTEKTLEEESQEELVGKIATLYLNRPKPDEIFGVRKKGGHHYIGNKHVIIGNNDIIIKDGGEIFNGTRGLWELITSKNPKNYNTEDLTDYAYLMIKTNALHNDYNPKNSKPRSSGGKKWINILGPIRHNREKYSVYKGKGVVVVPSDPNALIGRLDLLLASQEAGHTGVGNELVSICDEQKRQGAIGSDTYKKLNSIIKK